MRRVNQYFQSVFYLVLVLGAGLIYGVKAAEQLPPGAQTAATAVVAQQDPSPSFENSPEKFVGPEACADCHQAEYEIWSRTSHAKNAFDLLRTSSNAKHYANSLGLDAEHVSSATRCLACHSAPRSEADKRTGLVHGVTCESCHNAAGGEEGWLNFHATYGLHIQRREDETAEHRTQRIARCQSAGQNRCDNLYSLAKRCYGCHIVGDELLVVRGGHHPGDAGFEMTNWFDKQIRHNVCLNPQHNGLAPSLWMDSYWRSDHRPGKELDHRRLMYVVALLVDLEMSLRNRGQAEHASYASATAARIVAASSRLARIAEHNSARALVPAVDAVAKLESIVFSPPAQKDAQFFLVAADFIEDIARKISSEGRGDLFAAADQFLGPPFR